jgi:hypothetical protein
MRRENRRSCECERDACYAGWPADPIEDLTENRRADGVDRTFVNPNSSRRSPGRARIFSSSVWRARYRVRRLGAGLLRAPRERYDVQIDDACSALQTRVLRRFGRVCVPQVRHQRGTSPVLVDPASPSWVAIRSPAILNQLHRTPGAKRARLR